MQLAVAAVAAVRDHFSPSGIILYRLCRKFVQARRLIRFGDWRKDVVARPRLRLIDFRLFFSRPSFRTRCGSLFVTDGAFLFRWSRGGEYWEMFWHSCNDLTPWKSPRLQGKQNKTQTLRRFNKVVEIEDYLNCEALWKRLLTFMFYFSLFKLILTDVCNWKFVQ